MNTSRGFAGRTREDDFSLTGNSEFAALSLPAAPEFAFAAHASASFEGAGAKAKPVRVDRTPEFLEGAAAGENPVPEYDADLDTLAAYLTDGYWYDNGEARHSFDIEAGEAITFNITTLGKAGQKLARDAFETWTDLTGLKFEEVSSSGDIIFGDDGSNPSASAYSTVDGSAIVKSYVTITAPWLSTNGTGNYDYSMLTYIHEIGHALGLGHAGNYNGAATYDPEVHFANDSWQASVMSYFDQVENTDVDADRALAITPMMADILAIRELYGMVDIREGDDVYSFRADFEAKVSFDDRYKGTTARTIVDSGGTDMLDFSWSKKAVVLDLNEESFSSINGVKGNLAIARGTIIEGAVGGTGKDTITGNDYANALYGNSGADTLTGNGGEDFFVFDTRATKASADVITDFEIGVDTMGLNNKVFKAVGRDGLLTDRAFAINVTGHAEDRKDRIIYDSDSGELFYDENGSRKGGSALVATLEDGLALDASHFLVI